MKIYLDSSLINENIWMRGIKEQEGEVYFTYSDSSSDADNKVDECFYWLGEELFEPVQ